MEVSDKAIQCPKCANPLFIPTHTIELTGKKYKKRILLGWGTFILGVLWIFMGTSSIGILIIGFAVMFLAINKFIIWWHHK
jgi:hypothetical protein